MFASKVVKPQTKAVADSRNELAPQRSALATRPFRGGAVEQAHMLQRSIGSQATFPIPAQQVGSLAGNERNDRHEHEVETASLPTRGATPGVSWDFSKVPMFLPERANRLDARRSLCAPSLPGIIQRKLVVGEVDDPLEHEAERVAAQVMHMPAPPPHAARPEIDGRVVAGKTETLRPERAATPGGSIEDVPGVVHEALLSPGRSLDASSRAFFEPRFGHDFSRVRVHADPFAARSAQAINALAYTVGRDLVFGPNMYAPHSREGRTLLAHELAHAVQQDSGAPGTILRQISASVTGGTIDPRHARGYAGEQGMGFGYRKEKGWIFIEGPGGSAGHGVTAKGLDGVAYSVKADELQLIDNKSLRAATARSASALTTNLEKNLDSLIVRVKAMKDVPSRIRILQLLKQMRASIAGGTPLPQNTKLVVTGVGGQATDVSQRLKSLGVEFRDPGVTNTPISPAPNTPANDAPTGGGAEPKAGGGGEPKAGGVGEPKAGGVGEPKVPETVAPEEVSRPPAIGKSAIKLAVAEVALNVLLFAVLYYAEKQHAEDQLRKLNNDLKRILPDINTQVKSKEAEIMQKAKAVPLVYGNITVVYTHTKYDPEKPYENYNEGSMKVQAIGISHQNYQVQENLIKQQDVFERNDPTYSLTFSVPLFEEELAEKGASSPVRNYRQVREHLTDPAYKVRLQSAMVLYELAKKDQSLETLVVRDLLGLLKDEDASVRLTAAAFLSRLKAKIAIQYIREVIPITSDDKQKELIQRYLRELEQG